MNIRLLHNIAIIAMLTMSSGATADTTLDLLPGKTEVLSILNNVNRTWQERNPSHGNFFWNRAVYHVGNMEAYSVTNDSQYLDYSTAWAEHNNWCGATSNDTTEWSSSYGEGGKYVLFGDNQICFQVYADLYNYDNRSDERKIQRALGVMGYQITTGYNEYLWWVDGMFMVMPTMVKLYNITGDRRYLEKMHDYWLYATELMYDYDEDLYYRDAKYIYPGHQTLNGLKDFWARGDGWAFATLARLLDEMPADAPYRSEYADWYCRMAKSLQGCQQEEGYWTRSLLDPAHAPGRETSGTALNAYAYATGIRLGIISADDYASTLCKAWDYLAYTAYQTNGTVGYIQPIGEKADPNQTLTVSSYYDFGVGAFLMAAAAVSRIAPDKPYIEPIVLRSATIDNAYEITLTFNVSPNADEANVAANYSIDGHIPEGAVISYDNDRKITITLPDSLDYGVHTVEVSNIHSAEGGRMPEGQQQAMIRTVSLDSPEKEFIVTATGSQEGNPHTNAYDGSLDTRWSQEGYGQWICFDLNTQKEVYAVDIAFYNGNQRVFYFDIQTSEDNTIWSDAATGLVSSGLTNELERFPIPTTSARYVRIVGNGNSTNRWNSPTEIRIRYSNTNGITNTTKESTTSQPQIYDLQGRKLKSPVKKGIYIINHRTQVKQHIPTGPTTLSSR